VHGDNIASYKLVKLKFLTKNYISIYRATRSYIASLLHFPSFYFLTQAFLYAHCVIPLVAFVTLRLFTYAWKVGNNNNCMHALSQWCIYPVTMCWRWIRASTKSANVTQWTYIILYNNIIIRMLHALFMVIHIHKHLAI